MKRFDCVSCGFRISFEDDICENCGALLGFDAVSMSMVALQPARSALLFFKAGNQRHFGRYCRNHKYDACNWIVPVHEHGKEASDFCRACQLNRTIPNLREPENLTSWREMERAKKRLVYSIQRFGLPLNGNFSHPRIAFDFVRNAMTGHSNGVITIDIRESDPVERERTRKHFNEPYRTLLGHLRHESGHYFWPLLLQSEHHLREFRKEFGDERLDYKTALLSYYKKGAAFNWHTNFVSAYASSHPLEDWAETWAHYLHMVSSIDTAESEGLEPKSPSVSEPGWRRQARDVYKEGSFPELLERWLTLTAAINSLTRNMGYTDFYPFLLSPPAKRKMAFVHHIIRERVPDEATAGCELQLQRV